MRIAVLSPVSHGTGATCMSLLLGLRLGQGVDRVCITHTHPTDTSLRDASGVSGAIDKTTTPSMIIRTFQSVSTMTEQEYAQYCASVTRDVDLFTCTRAGDAVCSHDDSFYLAKYVVSKFPHKHVVVDVDNHSEEVQNEMIKACDVIVLTLRVSKNEISMLRSKLEQYKKTGILAGKKIAVLFNRWHGTVVTQKELAKLLGIHPKFVYVLPFNEYIAWAEFNSKFPQMWKFVVKGDARVLSVRAELDRLINGIRQQKVTDAGSTKASKLLGVKHVDLEEKEVVVPDAPSALALTQVNQHDQMISSGLPAGFGTPAQTGFVPVSEPVASFESAIAPEPVAASAALFGQSVIASTESPASLFTPAPVAVEAPAALQKGVEVPVLPQRSVEATSTPQRAVEATPTLQRAMGATPTPQRAAEATPTPQRAVEATPTPQRAMGATPTPQRAAEAAPTPQRAAEAAPTPQKAVEVLTSARIESNTVTTKNALQGVSKESAGGTFSQTEIPDVQTGVRTPSLPAGGIGHTRSKTETKSKPLPSAASPLMPVKAGSASVRKTPLPSSTPDVVRKKTTGGGK